MGSALFSFLFSCPSTHIFLYQKFISVLGFLSLLCVHNNDLRAVLTWNSHKMGIEFCGSLSCRVRVGLCAFPASQRWGVAPLGGSTFLGVNLASIVKILMGEAAVGSGHGSLGDPQVTSLYSKDFQQLICFFCFIPVLKCQPGIIHDLFQIWQHSPVLLFKAKVILQIHCSQRLFFKLGISAMFCFLYLLLAWKHETEWL